MSRKKTVRRTIPKYVDDESKVIQEMLGIDWGKAFIIRDKILVNIASYKRVKGDKKNRLIIKWKD